MVRPVCTLATLGWIGASAGRARRFRRALDDPGCAQRRILARYLRDNAETAYGGRFGFSEIRTAAEYQTRVPLTTYDDYAPYIDRIMAGEAGVLTRDPVLRLVPSSGSTSARKLIPYTRGLQRELSAAIGPWIVDLYRRRPSLAAGPAYWSISPAIDFPAAPDTSLPIGFDDDTAYLGGFFKRLVDTTLAIPSAVRLIGDLETWRYVTLLHLLGTRELRLISVWHPSFLTLLLAEIDRSWPRLLDDLGGGTVRPPCRLRPNPRRADELRRLGPDAVSSFWPNLGLISCWGDAQAAPYLDSVRDLFPGVAVQIKGLLATEGFVTIPCAEARPLAVTSHFFEFIGDDGRVSLAHKLEPGGVYSVVLTTGGGLYRYRLQDRVHVTGRYRHTPTLAFVGKEDDVSDRFGEKLSDGFVAGVLQSLFAQHALHPAFALLAPDTDGRRWRYALYVEVPGGVPPNFAADLEAALRLRALRGSFAPAGAPRRRHQAKGAGPADRVGRGPHVRTALSMTARRSIERRQDGGVSNVGHAPQWISRINRSPMPTYPFPLRSHGQLPGSQEPRWSRSCARSDSPTKLSSSKSAGQLSSDGHGPMLAICSSTSLTPTVPSPSKSAGHGSGSGGQGPQEYRTRSSTSVIVTYPSPSRSQGQSDIAASTPPR
ncbi:MAG: GH3 auxin-responsive promoter family protein [Planctomycetota bacterium]